MILKDIERIFIIPFCNTLHSRSINLLLKCENDSSLVIYWSNLFNTIFIQISLFEYYSIADKTINDQSSIIIHTINQLNRCRSIYKIFNETMTRIHIIQCIKYYHLPCQNLSLNLSCFYDDIRICSYQYYGD
ncbi:unnamed protein product [Rotaria sordida]|uniref:Uncharacterized protein n=1 Tax=Rotaria sordida TaxID=392033 RepID=A0A819TQZ6_9BILA|nr:unnamed protein product [Rotaria sordida]